MPGCGGDDRQHFNPMIAMLSTWEIIAILVVVLLLFGNRLPGMARSLGSGITEFKRGLKEGNKPDGGANPPSRPNDGPNDGAAR